MDKYQWRAAVTVELDPSSTRGDSAPPHLCDYAITPRRTLNATNREYLPGVNRSGSTKPMATNSSSPGLVRQ